MTVENIMTVETISQLIMLVITIIVTVITLIYTIMRNQIDFVYKIAFERKLLTEEERIYVIQGKFDGWIKILLSILIHDKYVINKFYDNIEHINFGLNSNIALAVPAFLHGVYGDVGGTACNIRDEIDAVLKDNLLPEINSLETSGIDDINTKAKIENLQKIQKELTNIQEHAKNLVTICRRYSKQLEKDYMETNYMLGALQITNVYDRIKNTLCCIQIRIKDLRKRTDNGIETISWLISSYEKDRNRDDNADEVCRMYSDLDDIKYELGNIDYLVTKLIYS